MPRRAQLQPRHQGDAETTSPVVVDRRRSFRLAPAAPVVLAKPRPDDAVPPYARTEQAARLEPRRVRPLPPRPPRPPPGLAAHARPPAQLSLACTTRHAFCTRHPFLDSLQQAHRPGVAQRPPCAPDLGPARRQPGPGHARGAERPEGLRLPDRVREGDGEERGCVHRLPQCPTRPLPAVERTC